MTFFSSLAHVNKLLDGIEMIAHIAGHILHLLTMMMLTLRKKRTSIYNQTSYTQLT